jgi:GNAT superfamily N-acetyltransferase
MANPDVSSTIDIVIRLASTGDSADLADLAARTFRETFEADNPAEDMAMHVARSYGPAIQHAELANPTMRCLLAEVEGRAAAYAQLREGPPPECVTGPRPYEIWRFYVDRPWLGRGVAQRLMDRAIAEARSLGKQTLWLGVWEKNPRAIAFYHKCGFIHVGEHGFLFADQMQTDLVMTRPV